MIFNMGGRPGQAVCKRLFERRGLRVTKLWQTKVIQVSDNNFQRFYCSHILTIKIIDCRQLILIYQP